MKTLTEFLLARIEEDEVNATLRQWHGEDCPTIPDPSGYSYPCECGVPERMKREAVAKRQVVEIAWGDHLQIESEWGSCRGSAELEAAGDYPVTLRSLGVIYADHPEYREEWRPMQVENPWSDM